MAEKIKDDIEEIETSADNSLNIDKQKVLTGLLVVLLAAGLFFAFTEYNNSKDTTTSKKPNNSQKDNIGKVGVTPNSIEGKIVDVNITEIKAVPFRPKIAQEDGVKFHNNAGEDIKFTFDRKILNFTLEKGETTIVDTENIVYYDVLPAEEGVKTAANGGSFRVIEGGINVQS